MNSTDFLSWLTTAIVVCRETGKVLELIEKKSWVDWSWAFGRSR